VIENEQCQTSQMSKVWKAFGIHNRARKRFATHATPTQKREAGCHLYRMLSEEKIILFILLG